MSFPDDPVAVSTKTGQVTADPTKAFDSEHPATQPAPIDRGKDPDQLPPAEITPERIANLPTTNDDAPDVSQPIESRASDPEIEDLGWSEDPKTPIPLFRGVNNEQLWILVRRFNQQIYEVQAVQDCPKGHLDLNIADDEQFAPDKLRATLERLYISVGVRVFAAAKHVARLRTWNEHRRTTYFCITYFTAWLFDLIIPTLLLTTLALILSPRSRQLLFPTAPLSAVSVASGKVQTPPAAQDEKALKGVVVAHPDSKDSLTGAPEAYSGQAVEQEASNFVTELGALAVGSVTGQGAHPSSAEAVDPSSASPSEEPPSPVDFVSSANVIKSPSTVKADPVKHDKTKAPIQAAVWTKASPVMHMLDDLSDTFERFGNALSPMPPFSQHKSRIRLALVVLPLFFVSLFISAWMVWKGVTFGIGVAIFGQPIFDRVSISGIKEWLDQHYPRWKAALQLRNSILRGVPTNAQLTITMLRIGEANKAPLPPPPPPSHAPPLPSESHSEDEQEPKKKKKGSGIVSAIKGTTKLGLESVLGFNRVKASVGSEKSKTRVGVVQPPEPALVQTEGGKTEAKYPSQRDGPVYFGARYRGKKGFLVISTSGTTPAVGFELTPVTKMLSTESEKQRPMWSMALEDIQRIRKVGGLGWRSKLLVGWSMGDEVVDGMEISDVTGETYVITAMRRRDEAFNRLIAMGNQDWKSM